MQLYNPKGLCNACPNMTRKLVLSLVTSIFLTGCTTTTITNLTPKRLPRNPSGLYLFEVALDSNQQTLRKNSVQPHLLIGPSSQPMQPALMLSNRWEALVPISATNGVVRYRFKFDYTVNRFGSPGGGSKLSDPFQIEITQ